MADPATFYVPVGSRLDDTQLAAIGLEDLRGRSLYDPRYAGFTPDFRWQDHANVRIDDPELRAQVEGALDQLSRTPEGQHVLRQAAAMQMFRMFGTLTPTSEQREEGAVPITGEIADPNWPGGFNSATGILGINAVALRRAEYLGQDGQYHDASLQNVLLHELGHAMDGLNIGENFVKLREIHHPALMQQVQAEAARVSMGNPNFERSAEYLALGRGIVDREGPATYIENPAIRLANDIMARYYQETPRVELHSAKRLEAPGQDVPPSPTLGTDRYYDTMITTDTISPPLPTNGSPRHAGNAPSLP